MYPGGILADLAQRENALRQRIALRRVENTAAAVRVLQPVAAVDSMVALWRCLPPAARLSALPLGVAALRILIPRAKTLRGLLRWAPVAIGTLRALRGWRRARPPAA